MYIGGNTNDKVIEIEDQGMQKFKNVEHLIIKLKLDQSND